MPIIYAIGDIHGRPDLLQPTIDFIQKHAERSHELPRVYFLGDVVDRGYDSRGAMQIVHDTIERWPDSRLILGNHDETFRAVLEDPDDFAEAIKWCSRGGSPTFYSYRGYGSDYDSSAIRDIATRFADHLGVLRNAPTIETVGRYCFVHAGIDPLLPISSQDPDRCRTIRDEFLDHVGPLSHIIVHGHTQLASLLPTVTENRISLDTGACHSSVLSMAAIDPETDEIDFFSTTPDRGTVPVEPIRLDRGFGTILDGKEGPIGRNKRSAA